MFPTVDLEGNWFTSFLKQQVQKCDWACWGTNAEMETQLAALEPLAEECLRPVPAWPRELLKKWLEAHATLWGNLWAPQIPSDEPTIKPQVPPALCPISGMLTGCLPFSLPEIQVTKSFLYSLLCYLTQPFLFSFWPNDRDVSPKEGVTSFDEVAWTEQVDVGWWRSCPGPVDSLEEGF